MLLGRRLQSRHERRFRTDLGDLAPRYGVKRSIETQHAKIEGALVLGETPNRAPVAHAQGDGLVGLRRVVSFTAAGVGARVPGSRRACSNLRDPTLTREVRQVRAENAAFASYHVTARTVAAAREEPFAGRRVAGGRVIGGRRPQHLDVVDERVELGISHRESGHRRARDSAADQFLQRGLRTGTWPANLDEAWALAAAAAVGPMAANAARFIGFPPGLERLRENTRARGCESHGCQQQDSPKRPRHDGSVTARTALSNAFVVESQCANANQNPRRFMRHRHHPQNRWGRVRRHPESGRPDTLAHRPSRRLGLCSREHGPGVHARGRARCDLCRVRSPADQGPPDRLPAR